MPINHEEGAVSGEEYNDLLKKMYPGQLNQFGHISMKILRTDCILAGARLSWAYMYSDNHMVYFLAKKAGLI